MQPNATAAAEFLTNLTNNGTTPLPDIVTSLGVTGETFVPAASTIEHTGGPLIAHVPFEPLSTADSNLGEMAMVPSSFIFGSLAKFYSNTVDKLGSVSQEWMQKVQPTITQAREMVTGTFNLLFVERGEKVANRVAAPFAEQAKQVWETTKATTQEVLTSAGEYLATWQESAQEVGEKGWEKLKDVAKDTGELCLEKAKDGVETLKQTASENPYTTAAVVTGVTAATVAVAYGYYRMKHKTPSSNAVAIQKELEQTTPPAASSSKAATSV